MVPNGSYSDLGPAQNLRLRAAIRGAVQGVGFRPFVYRLATELELRGWVSNTAQGVFIEAEGPKLTLDQFVLRLEKEKPTLASIQSSEYSFLDPVGFPGFEIRESESRGPKTTLVLPDIATCPDCLNDIFDPDNRRHLYPFTNCTNCGPRFTIIESLPYDRANTSMKAFRMCPDCEREYTDPRNRRFHAQPNACPVCGPRMELWNETGTRIADNLYAILEAADAIRRGKIVAVKGLGGFHLIVDAAHEEAVARLRELKRREEKPFALMVHSLERIKEDCIVTELEERLLLSPESPIVLLKRKNGQPEQGLEISLTRLSSNIAPNNPFLGIMLPYTPLHHILMRELKIPVIATSGNLSDEPICTDEREALTRLKGIADCFLVHNRPIIRHVDDSIVRVLLGRELVLRRARGYAPLPLRIDPAPSSPVIGVGAHLKNTIAVSSESNVFISQHIGDLETKQSYDAFQNAIRDFKDLYAIEGTTMVCDMHPDYLSSKFAHRWADNTVEIQHHYAHIASCIAENEIVGPVLGVSWDGTGFGADRTVWGGEFLVTNKRSFERRASFAQFMLPGNDAAVKEPRRSAIGALFEIYGLKLFTMDNIDSLKSFRNSDLEVIGQMLEKRLNSPRTSSVGRLFDAVASILGLHQTVRFEGQAAMDLEFLALGSKTDEVYPLDVRRAAVRTRISVVDWKPMILAVLEDLDRCVAKALIAAKFHNTLVHAVLKVAEEIGMEKVVLSGGCFQNSYLLEHCVTGLQQKGFRPYWHQRVPPNDGGISLGQIYAYSCLQTLTENPAHTRIAQEIRT